MGSPSRRGSRDLINSANNQAGYPSGRHRCFYLQRTLRPFHCHERRRRRGRQVANIARQPPLNERGAKIVISQHPRRSSPLNIDAEIYKWRHLIENFFCKLKEFKRIAKTDQSFAAMIYAGATIINSR